MNSEPLTTPGPTTRTGSRIRTTASTASSRRRGTSRTTGRGTSRTHPLVRSRPSRPWPTGRTRSARSTSTRSPRVGRGPRSAAPPGAGQALHGGLRRWLGGPGSVDSQLRGHPGHPDRRVQEQRGLRPELHPERPGLEPRREPAERRVRAQGALLRHGALRQPALAPARQAEHRLGQDGALPHHRPVQSPGSRPRFADQPGGVPDRPLGASRGVVLLQRRAARGSPPRARDELRRIRADRPGPLRRALRAASGLRQDLGTDGPRVRAGRDRGRGQARQPLGELVGDRGGWPPGVALRPLQLRTHRLLRLQRRGLHRAALPVRPQRRSDHGPAPLGDGEGPVPERQRGELSAGGQCTHPPQRQPAELPLHLRHQHRLQRSSTRPSAARRYTPASSRSTPAIRSSRGS